MPPRAQSTHKFRVLLAEQLDQRNLMAGDLVASDSGKLWFEGTPEVDHVAFVAGETHHLLTINGDETQIPVDDFPDVRLKLGSEDAVEITCQEGVQERFKNWDTKSVLTSPEFELTVYGAGETSVQSHVGENDRAYFYGTAADERVNGSPDFVHFARPEGEASAAQFGRIYVYAGSGEDAAQITDGPGADKFRSTKQYDILDSEQSYLKIHDFDVVHAEAVNGGDDRAYQWDSPDDDFLLIAEDVTKFVSESKTSTTSGFERFYAFSNQGGHDHVKVYDTVYIEGFAPESDFASTGEKNGVDAVPGRLRFFSDDFYRRADQFEVEDVLIVNPRALAGRFSVSGAVSVNADLESGESSKFYIEQQRRGSDLIMAGLGIDNHYLIEMGMRMIQWGVDQQSEDGSFAGSGDQVHSTTMFMHAIGLSIAELDRYGYEGFEGTTREQWIRSLDSMADWVLANSEASVAVDLDPYSHRFFLRAVGFRYAAAFANDARYQDESDRYFDEGIVRLTEDSVMPEKGRFDLNYQTLGLRYATDYAHFEPSAERLAQIQDLFTDSLEVILPRIDENGIADLSDSSRTGERDREGRIKTFDYRNAVRAYYGGHCLTENEGFLELANRVFQHDKALAHAALFEQLQSSK